MSRNQKSAGTLESVSEATAPEVNGAGLVVVVGGFGAEVERLPGRCGRDAEVEEHGAALVGASQRPGTFHSCPLFRPRSLSCGGSSHS